MCRWRDLDLDAAPGPLGTFSGHACEIARVHEPRDFPCAIRVGHVVHRDILFTGDERYRCRSIPRLVLLALRHEHDRFHLRLFLGRIAAAATSTLYCGKVVAKPAMCLARTLGAGLRPSEQDRARRIGRAQSVIEVRVSTVGNRSEKTSRPGTLMLLTMMLWFGAPVLLFEYLW